MFRDRFVASVVAVLTASAIAVGAAAQIKQSEPILLIKPLAAGVMPPRVATHPPLPTNVPDTANRKVCLTIDIRSNGTPANVKVLQSSGDTKIDEVWVDIASHSQFLAATLNGMPITVRLISVWGLDDAKPPAGPCAWNLR